MVQNKGLIFKSVPSALPKVGEHLAVEDRPFDLNTEPPKDGITTKNYAISFDPYQRGRMRDPKVKSYSPPFQLGEPITNTGIAKVLKSNNSKFKEGEFVVGMLPTEEYSVVGPELINATFRKFENPYKLDPKFFLGVLGMPGLTGYSSFYEIGQPKKGETIFISSAAGPVGQIVGQLAKHEGLKVIGSVGDDKKVDFVTKDLDFDAAFNYKKEKPSAALKRLAPNGIDIYFENVGGEHLDAALNALNDFGRIIGCGMISQYNLPPAQGYGVKSLMNIIAKRITFRGFIVSDPAFGPKHSAEHQKNLQKWLSEGTFKAQLSVTEGIDNSPDGLLGLFEGKNFGKAVLSIAPFDEQ